MKVSRRVRVDAEQRELTLLALNAPLGSDSAVQDIRDDTSGGTSDDVEETEPGQEVGVSSKRAKRKANSEDSHRRPLTGLGLTPLRLVLKVISREDGVDGELSSESAKVAAKRSEVSQARRSSRWPINSREGEHDRLRAHESGENLLESRSDDDFVDGSGLPASRGSSLVDLGESLALL